MNTSLTSVASEKAILSQLLADPDMIYQVRSVLDASDFTDDTYRDLYALMVTLSTRPRIKTQNDFEKPFDPDVLRAYFGNDEDGRLSLGLSSVMASQSLFGTVGAHSDILKRKSYRRRVVAHAEKLTKYATDEQASEEDIEKKSMATYQDLRLAQSAKPILDPQTRMDNLSADMAARERGEVVDVKTGYARLDQALGGGFIKGTFNVITAQTGGFKSTFALAMARRMAHYYGYKVLYISIEMPDIVLSQKDVSATTGVDLDALRDPKSLTPESKEKIQGALRILQHSNYYSWPYSGTVADVRAVCQEMKLAIGLDVVVVDYLQILSGGGNNLYQEISAFSSKLREMAKDENVVCVCLAQMNRSIFGSPEMLPHISMLKDSGSIENDSASIIALYWPWAVSLIPGHYVPDDHTPLTEMAWRTAGARRPPTLDSYRGMAIPPSHELQALVLKHRLGQSQALVRLGVTPASHDVFCPFTSEADHVAHMLAVLQRPRQGPLNGISVREGWTEETWLNTLSSKDHIMGFDGDMVRRALAGNQEEAGGNLAEMAIAEALSNTYGRYGDLV